MSLSKLLVTYGKKRSMIAILGKKKTRNNNTTSNIEIRKTHPLMVFYLSKEESNNCIQLKEKGNKINNTSINQLEQAQAHLLKNKDICYQYSSPKQSKQAHILLFCLEIECYFVYY